MDIGQILSQSVRVFPHHKPQPRLACCWSHERFLSHWTDDRSAHWWCLETCRRSPWSSSPADWENRWPDNHAVRSVVLVRVRSASLDRRLFWMTPKSKNQHRSKDHLYPHLTHRNNVDHNTWRWLPEDPWPCRFSCILFSLDNHRRVPWSSDGDVVGPPRPYMLHSNHTVDKPCSYTDGHRARSLGSIHRSPNSLASLCLSSHFRSWKETRTWPHVSNELFLFWGESSCTSYNTGNGLEIQIKTNS